MSLPSMRSSSTLTPIENLDYLESGPLGATQRNYVPPNLTDPSGNSIVVHAQEKTTAPESDMSKIEPEMLYSNRDKQCSETSLLRGLHSETEMALLQKTRIILPSVLRDAWKVNNKKNVISNERISESSTLSNNSSLGTDNTVNSGSDLDNKDIQMGKEVAMNNNDEDANGKGNIVYDKDNAIRQTTADEHGNAIKRTSHFIDGSESNNNYSESIFDSDFFDDTTANDRTDLSVNESFLESDTVPGHSRRMSKSFDSMKLFRTEPGKSRRSSVYYEMNSHSDQNLHTISHENVDEKSRTMTMASKRQDSTSTHLYKTENSGDKVAQNSGNSQSEMVEVENSGDKVAHNSGNSQSEMVEVENSGDKVAHNSGNSQSEMVEVENSGDKVAHNSGNSQSEMVEVENSGDKVAHNSGNSQSEMVEVENSGDKVAHNSGNSQSEMVEVENSGDKVAHNSGNSQSEMVEVENSGSKVAHNRGNSQSEMVEDNEHDHQEMFYLDMSRQIKHKKSATAASDDILKKCKIDSKHGDANLDMNLNNNSDSINQSTQDKGTANANIRSDKQNIQGHAMANINLLDSTEEQIKATNTVGINDTEGSGTTDAQSVHSGEYVYGKKDVSIKHQIAWASVDQYDPNSKWYTESTELENGKEMIIADNDDKYTLRSNGEENRGRLLINRSDIEVESNESNLLLDHHSEQGIRPDIAEQLNTMSEDHVDENENISEKRKINTYSIHGKVRGKEDSKPSSKSRITDQSIKDSKSAPESLPKQPMSNRQSNYKSIVEMKALDRLLTGPYSETLSKKSRSPRRGIYRKATKASINRIHKQYTKLADAEEDNNTSKPATSETKDRVGSSRKHGESTKATGSAKSTNSNTRNSKSILTVPLNEARPVKVDIEQITNRETVSNELVKPAVGKHQRQHNQTEMKTEMTSKLSFLESEKRDLPEVSVTHTLGKDPALEAARVKEVEKNTISLEDESVKSLESVETSPPEYIRDENITIPIQQEQTEVQDNCNNLQANLVKLELVENTNVHTGLGIPREQDTQTIKSDKPEMEKKLSQVRGWSIARAKIKASLPKLVREKGTTHNEERTNERDQSLDGKDILTKFTKDTEEASGSVKKAEETSNNKSRDTKETVGPAVKKTKTSNPKTRDTKETMGSATKKREELSNNKTLDTKETAGSTFKKTEPSNAKETVGSATKKKEEPLNSKTRDTKQTAVSAKKAEEPSNPKTRDTKASVGSATKKTEESSVSKTRNSKEAVGSATKKAEEPVNPKFRDAKETVDSSSENIEEPTNPKPRDIKETKKPIMKKTEDLTIPNIQNINETTEPDIKETKERLVSKTYDVNEASEPMVLKTEEPAHPTDQFITPPASVTIVDETLPPQTQPNFLIDQVILQDILQKYKTKTIADHNNSNTVVLPNGSPGSPPPEPLIGNGVSKFQDRSTAKSVSIQSLTVPGLQSNSYSTDPPIDEDAISIYSRRDSVRQSFDSGSRKSVDYRIRNTALVVLPTTDEKPKSVLTNDESFIKNAIPFLPMKMAVLCLVLNIIVPGAGTALSGLAILFCGQPRVLSKDDQVLITLCANCMVGVAQLCTITFLLVGWFWSVSWGIEMIILSVQYERNLKQLREKEIQSLALNAFGSPKRHDIFGT